MTTTKSWSVAGLLTLATISGSPIFAQEICGRWEYPSGLDAAEFTAKSVTTWDVDGAGPTPERFVIAVQRNNNVSRVLLEDGAVFNELGGLIFGELYELTVFRGDLYVAYIGFDAGYFSSVWRWNIAGQQWEPTGLSGVYGAIRTMRVHGDRMYVGGDLSVGVRMYDGIAWTAMGPNTAGVDTISDLVSHDGLLWAVEVDAVPGVAGVTTQLRTWNGLGWSTAIASGTGSDIRRLASFNGHIYAFGSRNQGYNSPRRLEQGQWVAFANTMEVTLDICRPLVMDGHLLVGGRIVQPDGAVIDKLYAFDGNRWQRVPGFLGDEVNGLAGLHGQLGVVGRTFGNASPWSVWTPCLSDINCSGSLTVQDIFDFLAAYFSGSVAGDFNNVGGLTVQDIFDFLAAYFAGC